MDANAKISEIDDSSAAVKDNQETARGIMKTGDTMIASGSTPTSAPTWSSAHGKPYAHMACERWLHARLDDLRMKMVLDQVTSTLFLNLTFLLFAFSNAYFTIESTNFTASLDIRISISLGLNAIPL